MKEWLAFILPPATAFAGMRLNRLVLGQKFEEKFGLGLRFAIGLAVGMLVFSQTVLLGALAGVNLAGGLAWLALIWGAMEVVLLLPKVAAGLKQIKPQPGHLWLLLLLPVIYSWWVFGRLSTLEGTLEFDANAFWVFKAKILYLEQGKNLLNVLHQSDLGYAHLDYPMLVSCLYTFDYGVVGGVDEFVNKVWPFWMVVALCLGILSLGRVWKRPHPLPIVTVVAFCFLPASLQFIRQEGGTMPMVFFVSLTALLIVKAISCADEFYLAAAIFAAAGCATTKFEGVVYSAVWFCALLPLCWRRGWLKKPILWKSALVAVICLLPYAWFRLDKPVLHPESGWWHAGIAAPALTLHRFPQAWFLNVFGRFFNSDFFHWQSANGNHLQWAGKWTGLGGFVNEQLTVLPWLSVILLALAWWQRRARLALGSLSVVMLGVFTVLSFVIACLPRMQGDLANVIDFSTSNQVGRYYFPFFAAWFLAVAAIWFDDPQPSPSAATPNSPRDHPSPGRATPPKKQR
ncbi:MAG: hypothetical protein ABSD57_10440 [Verrucomicrobiota bacterium]|jgi:hypothetical protein